MRIEKLAGTDYLKSSQSQREQAEAVPSALILCKVAGLVSHKGIVLASTNKRSTYRCNTTHHCLRNNTDDDWETSGWPTYHALPPLQGVSDGFSLALQSQSTAAGGTDPDAKSL